MPATKPFTANTKKYVNNNNNNEWNDSKPANTGKYNLFILIALVSVNFLQWNKFVLCLFLKVNKNKSDNDGWDDEPAKPQSNGKHFPLNEIICFEEIAIEIRFFKYK